MTQYKTVLVPFPFDDLSSQKVRPALCLTHPIGSHRHVVLAFISSRIDTTLLPTDILLQMDHPDFFATGLRVPSVLRLHRLITVTTSFIQRELGYFPTNLQAQVAQGLQHLFSLP
ncbi:MAG: type II toxin-antitoxin system PemK/MazF family toxin [Chloroflexi bacterium]|nr:type II toxin-antitoxin system PemK/MazF family toxin [Chloroflexota bacterium]